jgi:hypothetical protein
MDASGAAEPAESNDDAELRHLEQRSVIDFDDADHRTKDPKATISNSRRNQRRKTMPLATAHWTKKKRIAKARAKFRKVSIVWLMDFVIEQLE